MGKLNSNKIERLSIKAIKDVADHPFSGLVTDIKEGDKGVSFDGEITIFLNTTEQVESFLGKVLIQVKGKEVKEFSGNTRKFPLSLKHYKNYYKQSGVLLLVVELKINSFGDCDSKIFYKQLLPQELSNLIQTFEVKKKQGSKSIELRALEESNLRTVCIKFFNEQKQQPLTLVESKKSVEAPYREYIVRSLTYDPVKESTNNMFEHDFFIYGKDEVYNILIPLNLGRITKIGYQKEETMNLGGKIYQFMVKTTVDEKTIVREFEGVLTVIHKYDTNKVTFNISNFMSLKSQIKTLGFTRTVLTNLKVPWDNQDLELETKSSLKEFIKQIDNRYKLMLEVQKVFKALNIPEDTLIEQIHTNKDIYMQLEHLVDFYLYNNNAKLNMPEEKNPKLFNYRIGNKLVVLYYRPSNDKKIINIFSDEAFMDNKLVTVQNNLTKESYSHSLYILLGLESLVSAINLNLEKIKNSFDYFDPFLNKTTSSVTNIFYLNCIRAFDITKNKGFLEISEHILSKYYSSLSYDPHSYDAAIVKVNELQIRKRKNLILNDSDIEILLNYKLIFSFAEYTAFHFSINVLLENKREAEFAYQKMDNELQEFHREYPIYFLYDQLLHKQRDYQHKSTNYEIEIK
ncbi:DUF4365 domain-containing protein [Paenibacillus sonchi]|uniref:DUF4365 domain-containing protein n=1 Tax=Paenibacillus sonchi TaxID=373687 RepID=UPI001E3266DF|nr:DUF4365 domain-containing protein [Paenibacillus sonchi]